MKNLVSTLILLLVLIGTTNAQINRYQFPKPVAPKPQFDLRFNCADLAVTLQVHRIIKVSGNNFKVIFKATLKNRGRRGFNNWSNPAQAHLRAINHPNSGEDAVLVIPQMRAGESRVTYLTMPWSTSWRVAPSVVFSLNAHPADCNRNNNKAIISHQSIVRKFSLEKGGSLPFGRF